MTPLAVIGATALYLLFIWLASAIAASWLSDRKGYGEKAGLATGLLLSAVAVLVWLRVAASRQVALEDGGPTAPSQPTGAKGRAVLRRGVLRQHVSHPSRGRASRAMAG